MRSIKPVMFVAFWSYFVLILASALSDGWKANTWLAWFLAALTLVFLVRVMLMGEYTGSRR